MAKFNVLRYRQLLAKNESLDKKYKSLNKKKDKNFFFEPDFLELLSCKGSVETQVFYNHKNKYFALIKKYLGEIINPKSFRFQFMRMALQDMREADRILNDFEELSTFWIDSELDEFSSLFEEMNEICVSTLEFEDEDDAVPEEEFRESVEKIFSQIQKYSD